MALSLELTLCLAALAILVASLLPRILRIVRRQFLLMAVPAADMQRHWLFGHLPYLRPGPHKFRFLGPELLKKQPRLRKFVLGPGLCVVSLCHPETAGVVMRSSAPKNDFFYSLVRPFIGDGLLLSTGKKWARDRRLLTPAFHFNILTAYHSIYMDAAATMLGQWSKHVEDLPGAPLNISKFTSMLTLDVTLRCAMGYQSGCQSSDTEYSDAVVQIGRLVLKRATNVLLYPNFVFYRTADGKEFRRLCGVCHCFCDRIIDERKKELQKAGRKREQDNHTSSAKQRRSLDFLDILLTCQDETGQGLTSEDIRDQVETFMFEGHDTTSSGLQWTLFYLAKHTDVQQRCREEIEAALAESDGELKHETLSALPYLTQCIKEGLRMATPVVYIERALVADVKVDAFTLPEGAMVSLDLWGIHHNPTVWDDPHSYNPDRFSPENSKGRHPLAFVPFSAGPRNCIGQSMAMDELKTVIAVVLLKFQLTADENSPEPVMIDHIVMRPQDGIHLKLSTR